MGATSRRREGSGSGPGGGEPGAFSGLREAEAERQAAERFVTGILRRKRLTEETVEALRAILEDLRALPGRRPVSSCEITVSCAYGDEDIGGTEYHTFILDDQHFELASGGTSYSAPVGSEDSIDGYRFVAEADGYVYRKMDVGPWIAEVEECCADPAYELSMSADVGDE